MEDIFSEMGAVLDRINGEPRPKSEHTEVLDRISSGKKLNRKSPPIKFNTAAIEERRNPKPKPPKPTIHDKYVVRAKELGFEVLGQFEYGGGNTKISHRCLAEGCGHVWDESPNRIRSSKKNKCPACKERKRANIKKSKPVLEKKGFNRDRPGYLYILVNSDKSLMKVGITNTGNEKARFADLRRSVDFEFTTHTVFHFGSGHMCLRVENAAHTFGIVAGVVQHRGVISREWLLYDASLIRQIRAASIRLDGTKMLHSEWDL